MRHESCIICRSAAYLRSDAAMARVVRLAELSGTAFHHHHLMRCNGCGHQWYDDILHEPGPDGKGVIDRRGSVPCPCPEDGRPRFQYRAVIFNVAEADCACGPGDLEQEHVVIPVAQ